MNDSDAFYLVTPSPDDKPEPVLKDLILSSEGLALPDIGNSLSYEDDAMVIHATHRIQDTTNVSDTSMDIRLVAEEPNIPQGRLEEPVTRTDTITLPSQTILPEKKEMPNIGS